MQTLQKSIVSAVICALAWHGGAAAQASAGAAATYEPTVGQSGKDVVWVPTPQALVDRMLDMAKLTPEDRLVDLGSGDGRTVITAAKRGATARGIEFNPDMVALARRAAEAEGVAQRARFEQADIFESDFSEATVITLFLLPSLNVKLRPTLLDMKPGTRIVSNSFTMGDWQPDESVQAADDCSAYCSAYKWVVPAKVAGTWRLDGKELVLDQTYQVLSGSLREGEQVTPISDARMDGSTIRFTVGSQRYTGQVSGDAMQGTTDGKASWKATLASR
ncbi:SAM-dependent methyltransferase [Bordetella petrii]|uniref:Methyltransferase domain-containing protein n=1 Tax=Bordetella petrii TaxID=94624 RepID=A0ABT7W4J9_9BORD|nr:class I SAM-dependent methyltransferase [Bordetella petrii]MDM9560130.1 methyltransferase domain-containing protein [Bordetella petrii]